MEERVLSVNWVVGASRKQLNSHSWEQKLEGRRPCSCLLHREEPPSGRSWYEPSAGHAGTHFHFDPILF